MSLHKGSLPNRQSFRSITISTFLYVYLDLFVLSLSLEFNIVNTGNECCLGPELGFACWEQVSTPMIICSTENNKPVDHSYIFLKQFHPNLIFLWSIRSSPLIGPFGYKKSEHQTQRTQSTEIQVVVQMDGKPHFLTARTWRLFTAGCFVSELLVS